jgi:hypothetical protein
MSSPFHTKYRTHFILLVAYFSYINFLEKWSHWKCYSLKWFVHSQSADLSIFSWSEDDIFLLCDVYRIKIFFYHSALGPVTRHRHNDMTGLCFPHSCVPLLVNSSLAPAVPREVWRNSKSFCHRARMELMCLYTNHDLHVLQSSCLLIVLKYLCDDIWKSETELVLLRNYLI